MDDTLMPQVCIPSSSVIAKTNQKNYLARATKDLARTRNQLPIVAVWEFRAPQFGSSNKSLLGGRLVKLATFSPPKQDQGFVVSSGLVQARTPIDLS